MNESFLWKCLLYDLIDTLLEQFHAFAYSLVKIKNFCVNQLRIKPRAQGDIVALADYVNEWGYLLIFSR